MPTVTRWFTRLALIYFILALTLALVLAARTLWHLPDWIRAWTPVYFHLIMVGWVTQLIFGVAYWMFPRRSPEQPRGNQTVIWAALILLNVGLIFRIFAEPMIASRPDAAWGWLLVFSALAQWLAGVSFGWQLWLRIKER